MSDDAVYCLTAGFLLLQKVELFPTFIFGHTSPQVSHRDAWQLANPKSNPNPQDALANTFQSVTALKICKLGVVKCCRKETKVI